MKWPLESLLALTGRQCGQGHRRGPTCQSRHSEREGGLFQPLKIRQQEEDGNFSYEASLASVGLSDPSFYFFSQEGHERGE